MIEIIVHSKVNHATLGEIKPGEVFRFPGFEVSDKIYVMGDGCHFVLLNETTIYTVPNFGRTCPVERAIKLEVTFGSRA